MSLQVQALMDMMDELAPRHLALGNDPVGLHIGNPHDEVKNIVTALDVDEDTLKEALRLEANVIISHHPLIFSPLTGIDYSLPGGALIREIIRNNMNVFVAHTNLDVAPRGVNTLLSELLELQDTEILEVTGRDSLLKLVAFVPEGFEDKIRDAISEAGAGWIGNYSHCTFQTAGTGTFLPREGTDPFIGRKGELEKVEEFRLETIFPLSIKKAVINALAESHPYEEVAYDLYPLENEGIPVGLGYVGKLNKSLSLGDLAQKCADKLHADTVHVFGDKQKQVHKVAVCGGSGGSLIQNAAVKGADVFVSGDFKYHDIKTARSMGLSLIDAGHYGTEYPVIPWLARYLQEKLAAGNCRNKILPVPGKFRAEYIQSKG